MKQRIFISSVQMEFAVERQVLKAYLLGDALLSRFFDVFLFEDIPARDRRADAVYIEEVRHCDLYLALLGNEYGREDKGHGQDIPDPIGLPVAAYKTCLNRIKENIERIAKLL